MLRKLTFLFVLVLVFAAVPLGVVSAQPPSALNLPPGIEKQAQPYIEAMMQRMQDMGMSLEQMQMMMADMQSMADQLPPGIFLQVLKLMPQLEGNDMMAVHQQLHQGDLLKQPPGKILIFIKSLVR
jgi:hypothetical protein